MTKYYVTYFDEDDLLTEPIDYNSLAHKTAMLKAIDVSHYPDNGGETDYLMSRGDYELVLSMK